MHEVSSIVAPAAAKAKCFMSIFMVRSFLEVYIQTQRIGARARPDRAVDAVDARYFGVYALSLIHISFTGRHTEIAVPFLACRP